MTYYVCVPVYVSEQSRIGKPSVMVPDKRYIEIRVQANSEGQALQILAGAITRMAIKRAR